MRFQLRTTSSALIVERSWRPIGRTCSVISFPRCLRSDRSLRNCRRSFAGSTAPSYSKRFRRRNTPPTKTRHGPHPRPSGPGGQASPREAVRFAATNHLCVDLTYDGKRRLIEPYSLRHTSAGNYVLHAERADGSGHRSYRVDRMQAVAVTTTPFQPQRAIEFSSRGPLHAPPQSRSIRHIRTSITSRPTRTGPVYVYQCRRCGREFEHIRSNSSLRAHDDFYGGRCLGRSGMLIGRR